MNPPVSLSESLITIEEFGRLKLKVAQIVKVQAHPNADKLLVLTVDVGGTQKELVAGIARHYRPEDLVGRRIVVVDNLQPATLRGVTSHGMLLAAQDGEGLSLIVPDRPVAAGSPIR